MIFALRDEVVDADSGKALGMKLQPGNVRLQSDKRPRPLVLRVNEGDCLHVNFRNLLAPMPDRSQKIFKDPIAKEPDEKVATDLPIETEGTVTRSASTHVNGLDYTSIDADGANIGNNTSSLAAPGETKQYTWYAKKIGGYLVTSQPERQAEKECR